jgi:hypothetical protein
MTVWYAGLDEKGFSSNPAYQTISPDDGHKVARNM